MDIILTVAQIQALDDNDVVFLDVRTKDTGYENGEAAYRAGHIVGAFYLNIKRDLTGENHFLPDSDTLAAKLGEFGLNKDTTLVLYDDGNQRAAAKAWYVLHYFGHQSLYILQGGFPAWLAAQQPVTTEAPVRKQTIYTLQPQSDLHKTITDVKDHLHDKSAKLIDSRAPERYQGETEPTYKKAGHIPGALNLHAKNVFDQNGNWQTKQALSETFSSLHPNENIIVSCGTGNSACMNYVALKEAGFQHVSLFSGGFKKWIEDDSNLVVKGKDPEGGET